MMLTSELFFSSKHLYRSTVQSKLQGLEVPSTMAEGMHKFGNQKTKFLPQSMHIGGRLHFVLTFPGLRGIGRWIYHWINCIARGLLWTSSYPYGSIWTHWCMSKCWMATSPTDLLWTEVCSWFRFVSGQAEKTLGSVMNDVSEKEHQSWTLHHELCWSTMNSAEFGSSHPGYLERVWRIQANNYMELTWNEHIITQILVSEKKYKFRTWSGPMEAHLRSFDYGSCQW